MNRVINIRKILFAAIAFGIVSGCSEKPLEEREQLQISASVSFAPRNEVSGVIDNSMIENLDFSFLRAEIGRRSIEYQPDVISASCIFPDGESEEATVIFSPKQYYKPDGSYSMMEGWRVPTKKDMMLEYVYTAVTNSSAFDGGFFWLNETKSDDPSIRWFIAMGIGEIVLAKEDASYFLRGVKDVSTGFRYPYVQGGKGGSNIIVSRDANGGVREEYVRTSRTTTVNGGEWDWWTQGTPHHTEIQASNIVSAKFEVRTKAIDPDFQRRVTWDDAAEYCSDQGEGWRLPTQRELMLMFVMNDYLEDGLLPSTNDVYPGEGETMNHVFYWSGTEDNSSTDSANTAWSVCFCNGDDVEHSGINGKVEGYMKTGTNYVRCVRDIY